MATVCLVTTGQPSTNPRLLKEADALVEAGHRVHVVCAHWAAWADESDQVLLASRRFSCTYVGGRPGSAKHWSTRVRRRAARLAASIAPVHFVAQRAVCRVSADLAHAASGVHADLFIAHNIGALPAAHAAARRQGSRLGFDAEDFHSGMWPAAAAPAPEQALVQRIEQRLLPLCDYVTASSPLIAAAYARTYGIPLPATVLNVFPLAWRPKQPVTRVCDQRLHLYWFSQTIGRDRGLEDVVSAMGQVGREAVLHVQGVWQDGYEHVLRRLALACRVPPENVVWHRPGAPHELIAAAAGFDVGLAVEPARDANNDMALSNKLFTYVLAGNAVVATATSAQRALFQNVAGAGALYAPGDVDGLAAVLRTWVIDRERVETARAAAWAHGSATFHWERERRGFLDTVTRVLAMPAARVA
jgi:glycosyltransferase involved in cell wall biosynthesis